MNDGVKIFSVVPEETTADMEQDIGFLSVSVYFSFSCHFILFL
jgi:hypothetical protein